MAYGGQIPEGRNNIATTQRTSRRFGLISHDFCFPLSSLIRRRPRRSVRIDAHEGRINTWLRMPDLNQRTQVYETCEIDQASPIRITLSKIAPASYMVYPPQAGLRSQSAVLPRQDRFEAQKVFQPTHDKTNQPEQTHCLRQPYGSEITPPHRNLSTQKLRRLSLLFCSTRDRCSTLLAMKNPAFAVRYSPAEKEILQASADAEGITLSSLIRNRSLNPWGTVEKPVLHSESPAEKRSTIPRTKLPPLNPLENPSARDYSSAYR